MEACHIVLVLDVLKKFLLGVELLGVCSGGTDLVGKTKRHQSLPLDRKGRQGCEGAGWGPRQGSFKFIEVHLVKEEESSISLCPCIVQPREEGVEVFTCEVCPGRVILDVLEQGLAKPPCCLQLLILLLL